MPEPQTRLNQASLHLQGIVLGTMARKTATSRERSALFRHAIDLGFTTLDTAPLYGFGEAERQIADALRGLPRGQVQVLTKVGLRWDGGDTAPVHFEFTDADGFPRTVRRDSRPESLRVEVERSLARLETDRLDLVQLHFRDTSTPISESIGALLRLREEGKLRHIGVCNFSPSELDETLRALGDVPLASVQEKYNLLQRGAERGALGWCRRQGVPFLAYSPLAEGRLGKPEPPGAAPAQRRINRFTEEVLLPASRQLGVAPAAIALRWLLDQPGVSAAIAGLSTATHLAAWQQALTVALDPQICQRLSDASRKAQLADPWEGGPIRRRARRLKSVFLEHLVRRPKHR